MKKKILQITLIFTIIFLTAAGLELSSTQAEGLRSKDYSRSNLYNKDSANLNVNITSDQNAPDNYELLQNYPNPFNPTTIIKYALPEENHITIKVFNSLGNEVQTLVDGTQSAGYHKVVFNGEDLSSGVYYAQLKADRFVKVIKMILVK